MTENKTNTESSANPTSTGPKKEEAWGYDLYPERRGTFSPKIGNILIGKEGKENVEKLKCEQNVVECVKTICDYSVSGGYDPELNQIVVCQNVSTRKGMVQGVLVHEMIHMFDYCRNELDFKNMEHLACSEIRAANLTHCSFTSAWSQGDASWSKIKKAHQDCVKTKALYSVLAVRQIGKAEAVDIIEKVFPKCYADLEPIGRRIRRNSEDMTRVLRDASYYGYD
ncbi:hypothetical protein MSG28_003317 [Choristoneura fumiferana]|uniref:Uncharacterized protein n=1 Tax=Choristoneura fumiferana TaxID=7141 RepID=A0ACC0KF14_CHOFU|nr:hypothetical protein MSG28_003317 [Choristoneura fumiferana]